VKVGILVVAYNAETTLVNVLERIPTELRRDVAEVLVQDDHSTDDTFAVAAAYLERGTELPLTVLRHAANLGYGGNQKAGYEYAIRHGWDVVVLLHGDGQYAPEVMDRLIRPIVDGDADAVFGSRMMTRGEARRGGMPLYKYVGNRMLTTAQNGLTGARLSEWHSGYRAYRVSALAELPFRANSDGFDFDTEIILELLAADKRILEVPIPTYYGDEICRVNGIAYAADIMIDTVRHRVGRSGFGAGTVGRIREPEDQRPSPRNAHGRIVEMMRARPPSHVLDLGCGPGWVALELRAMGHDVTGVDAVEHPGVRDRVARFVRADLDRGIPDEIGDGFDIAIAADVFEHVREPERLLHEVADRLAPGGTVLASIPNFGHWYPRLRVLTGRFDYDQRGILDATHLRFFTRRSFLRMVRRVGFIPVATRNTGLPFSAVGLDSGSTFVRVANTVDSALVDAWPSLFAYQFVFELAPPATPIN
jgi:2-polyprenyl-3-methyl-5-hydroxy-6-metoxy-1,4-benzoquinol methylase